MKHIHTPSQAFSHWRGRQCASRHRTNGSRYYFNAHGSRTRPTGFLSSPPRRRAHRAAVELLDLAHPVGSLCPGKQRRALGTCPETRRNPHTASRPSAPVDQSDGRTAGPGRARVCREHTALAAHRYNNPASACGACVRDCETAPLDGASRMVGRGRQQWIQLVSCGARSDTRSRSRGGAIAAGRSRQTRTPRPRRGDAYAIRAHARAAQALHRPWCSRAPAQFDTLRGSARQQSRRPL